MMTNPFRVAALGAAAGFGGMIVVMSDGGAEAAQKARPAPTQSMARAGWAGEYEIGRGLEDGGVLEISTSDPDGSHRIQVTLLVGNHYRAVSGRGSANGNALTFLGRDTQLGDACTGRVQRSGAALRLILDSNCTYSGAANLTRVGPARN